jgi:hypothetical protein
MFLHCINFIRSTVLVVDKTDIPLVEDDDGAKTPATPKKKVRTGYCIMPSTRVSSRELLPLLRLLARCFAHEPHPKHPIWRDNVVHLRTNPEVHS